MTLKGGGFLKGKIHLRDRVLLALYALLGFAFTLAAAIVLAGGFEVSALGGSYHISLGDGFWPKLLLAVLCAVGLIWSGYLMVLAFSREPKKDKGSVAVQNSENGSVRISVGAMDTLVKRAIGDAEGIVDIKTSIINHDDSISVGIEMTLESDVHIPNVTMLMQSSVKNFIEEFSGIAVREVTVMVTKIVEVTPAPPLAIEERAPRAQIAREDEGEPLDIEGADAAYPPQEEVPEFEPEVEAEEGPEMGAQEPEALEPQQAPEGGSSQGEGQAGDDGFSEKDIW